MKVLNDLQEHKKIENLNEYLISKNIDNIDDLDQLKCTANVTSGKLYNVNTEAELQRSFDETITDRKKVNALIVK